jgi:multidrug efflux pump subunit AcrB
MSKKKTEKEFGLSSWSINNKTSIWVLIFIFLFMGYQAYQEMPRENFPEVKETKIYISTVYPGNTAEDIEKLITKPIEDRVKSLSGVTDVTSTSQADYAIIIVEFEPDQEVADAKQRVKDKVDGETASEDWPTFNGAKVEPNVFDLNISEEMPILNVNFSGDYTPQRLREFADIVKDKIESFSEIKSADIRGVQDKEVEIAVDIYKMTAAKVSIRDISQAISNGNMTISAGNLIASGQRRTIRVIGEVENPKELENFVVKNEKGNEVYLKDIAEVHFKSKEKTTFARNYGKPVVMLDVKKRSGQNMVLAAQKIQQLIKESHGKLYPSDLEVTISNDQSVKTINQVDDLVNNIIFGIILVVVVLMFFLGFRNALFVGFAIPMSMFMSFMILNLMGYTLNTMILFGMIMGLGMLVDNGIVVVENVFRLMSEEGMTRTEAAKKGIGEIAFPIIISTLTTVAAFVPLGLWPGLMGQFMKYFPITLSVVLGSSLFVAIFFNSVLVSQFMSIDERKLSFKQLGIMTAILVPIGGLIFASGGALRGLGLVMVVTAVLFWAYRLFVKDWALFFQNRILTWMEAFYEKTLAWALRGAMPYVLTIGTFVFLLVVFGMFGASVGSQRTKIEFFPDNQPNQVIVYMEYPQGTDINKTNIITKDVENRVREVINQDKYIFDGENVMVESFLAQVGEGAGNPQTDGGSSAEIPHKGKITLTLREFKYRKGLSSESLRQEIQDALQGIYPGIAISVEKDAVGPPAGYPINIELTGDDYNELITTAERMRTFINDKKIPGIAEIKIDVNKSLPSMEVEIDRKKAGELGVSPAQIGSQLRQSLFGTKAGVYKEGGDDYDINIRFDERDRNNTDLLFNQNITFKNPDNGRIIEVPVSAVTSKKFTSSFSAIKHTQTKRVVTVYSALSPGFTDAAAIVGQIEGEMQSFDKPESVEFNFTGQIEEQNKQMQFLVGAFFTGLFLIFLILIFQFNSISKPTIIMLAIFLSLIGVFGGIVLTGASFVIMMTMMGIISLAGVVVNNGVVLLDYTQLLMDRKREELKVPEGELLSMYDTTRAIIQAGKARLRPVLLTAITTILGLIPLSQGININFMTLFNDLDANIYVGGDNVIFWGPLANAVIYGLFIATFLTLIVVPVLFLLVNKIKHSFARSRKRRHANIAS